MRIWTAFFFLVGLIVLGAVYKPIETFPGVQRDDNPPVTDNEVLVPPIGMSLGVDSGLPNRSPEFTHGELATFHPHGEQICASGCAASDHPTKELTQRRFLQLLVDYSSEEIDPPGKAFEMLLYFGRQTRSLIGSEGTGSLDPLRVAVLKRELSYTHAVVSIRLVDEAGAVRASLPPTSVPLDRRHEFELESYDLRSLIASGTVKRVGRDHLWTRL